MVYVYKIFTVPMSHFIMLAISATESFKLVHDVVVKKKNEKLHFIGVLRTFCLDTLRRWLSGEQLTKSVRAYSDEISFTLETSIAHDVLEDVEWEIYINNYETYGLVEGTPLNFMFHSEFPEFLGVVCKELRDNGFNVDYSDSSSLRVTNPGEVVEPGAVPGSSCGARVEEYDIIFA